MSTKNDLTKDNGRGGIKLAIAVTVAWLILCYIWLNQEKVFGLDRNAFGDFVGGVVGPVALIWIVVGVWLQGKDLRHQRIELARHVEATNKLVGVDRELLEHEREGRRQEQAASDEEETKAKPRFGYRVARKVATHNDGKATYSIDFENLGGPFVVRRIYDHQDKEVVIEGGLGRTVERGDRPYITIDPLQANELVRFLMTVTYGRDHVGTMEIVGPIGTSLKVNLAERV